MTKTMIKKNIYFPNLNGIRFIAAMMVILAHIEQTKSQIGLPFNNNLMGLGGLGVTLFFVLSGFLITYLLLAESQDTGIIKLSNFYIRRLLRIWPLYYLILVLAFFVIPWAMPFMDIMNHNYTFTEDYNLKLLLYMLILPNVEMALYPNDPIPFAAQAWSIGVEEQFYLIWPVIIRYFKSYIYYILSAIIIAYIIINLLLANISTHSYSSTKLLFALRIFFDLTRVDCMAVGGIGALLLFNNKTTLLNIIYNKKVQLLIYILTISMLWWKVTFKYLNHLHYSLLFIIIILNLSSNKNTIVTLNNKIVNYLGKISYGLYMYHIIAICLSFNIFYKILNLDAAKYNVNLYIYPMTIFIVIIMATISYELFEKLFLRKKLMFSSIISGDSAKNE